MAENMTVAVDLAKNVFELAISEIPGRVSRRKRLKRAEMMPFFAQLPKATVLLEACGSAHHWARSIGELGHCVVLLPPHRTSKYRDGSKTDRSDTKAMLEAFRNESRARRFRRRHPPLRLRAEVLELSRARAQRTLER